MQKESDFVSSLFCNNSDFGFISFFFFLPPSFNWCHGLTLESPSMMAKNECNNWAINRRKAGSSSGYKLAEPHWVAEDLIQKMCLS